MRFAFLALLIPASLLGQVPGELRGRVTTAESGILNPVADARVEIIGRSDATRSAVDGSFVLRGLEPRTYSVRVRAVGYRMYDVDVEIQNGRATTLDVSLEAVARALDAVVVNAARDAQTVGATTFDRGTIESSGRRDLGELLQTAPGVVVTQFGGPGTASRVSIRGSSASQVLVLLDGVPLNSPITGDADLSRVPLENVERVIVHTGAQSARFGPRALAGVIEIQTRRAVREASTSVRGGAWGEQNAALLIAGTRGLVGGSLAGDYRTVQGNFLYDVPAFRGGGKTHRQNSASTSRQILGALTFDNGAWSTSARASAQRLDRGLAGSIVQPSLTGEEGQQRGNIAAEAAYRRGAVSWNTIVSATRERATFRDVHPPFGVAYDDTVRATGVNALSSATIGGESFSALVGAEVRTTDVESTMLEAGAPSWQRVLSAFAGVRGTRAVGISGTRASVDLDARVDESSLAGSAVSPRARVGLSRDKITASASIGAGFAPPSLADQFFHEGVLVRPNPSLRPERTRQDTELRLAAQDVDARLLRVDAEGAVYRANIDGMILWFPDFRFIWSPSNFAVRRSGWEVSGRAVASALPLEVRGMLNTSDVVYTGSVLTGQVVYRPRTTGEVSFGGGPSVLRIDVNNRYVGERRTVVGSAINMLESYWRSDARLSSSKRWQSLAVTGAIGLDNLFDQSAAMLVDYPFPGRGWSVSLRVRRIAGP